MLPPLVALLLAARRRRPAHPHASGSRRAPCTGCCSRARGATRTASGRCSTRRRRSSFTGLAVALGLRAGLFNIGAESQLAAGGFCAALVGLLLPAGIPALLCLPLYILAAALGGGVVGAVPGVLKARFGAHEVIVTIMLNFIVLALLELSRRRAHLHVPETLHTPEIGSGALPRLSDFARAFHGSAANATILLAIARGGRLSAGSCSARGAASSCAPSGCSPTPRSTAA